MPIPAVYWRFFLQLLFSPNPTAMAYLNLTDIQKHVDSFHALKNLSLAIEKEEFVVFVGPSGCGKTTLLRSISGLETVTEGKIELDGRDISYEHP
jgi:multiple sugar transport system ATP-binding protein